MEKFYYNFARSKFHRFTIFFFRCCISLAFVWNVYFVNTNEFILLDASVNIYVLFASHRTHEGNDILVWVWFGFLFGGYTIYMCYWFIFKWISMASSLAQCVYLSLALSRALFCLHFESSQFQHIYFIPNVIMNRHRIQI